MHLNIVDYDAQDMHMSLGVSQERSEELISSLASFLDDSFRNGNHVWKQTTFYGELAKMANTLEEYTLLMDYWHQVMPEITEEAEGE